MFDWQEYLSIADQLVRQQNEAAFRSAISRAYYAIYNRAVAKLIEEGQIVRVDPTEVGKHKKTWDLYRYSSDGKRRQIGLSGDRLRKTRTDSDYIQDSTINSTLATTCVTGARRLFNEIDSL